MPPHAPRLLLLLALALSARALLASAEPGADTRAARRGAVISPEGFTRKQVGGGKAVIEIFKEGDAAFFGRLSLAPHASVPLHRDPTEEYLLIEQGGGDVTIDGETRAVRAGDLVYMPANAAVSFLGGPEPLVALQVFAGPSSARKYDAWEPAPPARLHEK